MKKQTFFGILLVLPFLILFLSMELIFRFIIDNGMVYEFEMLKYAKEFKNINYKDQNVSHLPNKKKIIMGVTINTDKDGFRNSSFENNKKNFLMIGDSMTLGFGARKTFTDHINSRFTDKNFLNSGIGNTNTIMQVNNFFKNQKNIKIDGIILNFFINDLEIIKLTKPQIIDKSYLFTFMKYKVLTFFYNPKNHDYRSFYKKMYEDNENLNKTLESLKKISDYCVENNLFFLVHFVPELNNIENYPFKHEESLITSFLNHSNIAYIQGYKFFKNLKSSELWVTFYDRHANDKAHKIMADYLEKYLRNYFRF